MQQETTTLQEAGTNVVSSFGSSMELVPVVLVVLLAFVALVLAGSSYERFRRFRRAVDWFASTFEYAVYGFVAVAAVAIVGSPVYLISQADGETQTWLLYGAGVLAAGYAGLVAVGYLVKPFIDGLLSNHQQYVDEHSDGDDAADAEVAD